MAERKFSIYDFDTIQKEIDRIKQEENKVTNSEGSANIGTISGVDTNQPNTGIDESIPTYTYN